MDSIAITSEDKTKLIAFIGLGVMGLPMAKNLVLGGFNVVGYNRSTARCGLLISAGGSASSTLGSTVKNADIIITMLPDSKTVESVVTGSNGITSHAKVGAYWVDCSTINPDRAVLLGREVAESGLIPLDAPVSGGEAGAVNGNLTVMVGGNYEAFQHVSGLLSTFGDKVYYTGNHGTGQTLKATNQMIVAGNLQILAEAVAFMQAKQISLDVALEILGQSMASSRVLAEKGKRMIAKDFDPGFRLELLSQDLQEATDSANEVGIDLPVANHIKEIMNKLIERGFGNYDCSSVILNKEQHDNSTDKNINFKENDRKLLNRALWQRYRQ